MSNQPDAELLARFTEEFTELNQSEPVALAMKYFDWFLVLAQLQLALRHPSNDGQSREIVVNIARTIQSMFPRERWPAIAEVADRGWAE